MVTERVIAEGLIRQNIENIGHRPVIIIAGDKGLSPVRILRRQNKRIQEKFDVFYLNVGENGMVIDHKRVVQAVVIRHGTNSG
jgi:hypothetical protein